jgi:tetratricopeptide (TPR) repeat protein
MRNFIGCLIIGIFLFTACQTGNKGSSGSEIPDTARIKLEVLTQQIEDDAGNADLYQKRARFFISSHDFDKALKDIRQAISMEPKNSAFYGTLSDIYLLLGQPDNCKEALNKAIGINSKDTDALLKLAKLYLIIKDYPNCFSTIKQLLAIDQANSGAYFTRAIALLEKGDTIVAVKDLQKAVENNQEFYDAYIQLGELYSIKKDPMAELYFKNALNLRPQSREALYMLGMFYQESSRFEKAISTYEILMKADTSFREAPYNIGYVYLVYLKDFSKAITFFSESIRKDPEYYKAYYNRGYAYELSGDYKKAREDYQKTLKLHVNYDKAIEGLNRLDKL